MQAFSSYLHAITSLSGLIRQINTVANSLLETDTIRFLRCQLKLSHNEHVNDENLMGVFIVCMRPAQLMPRKEVIVHRYGNRALFLHALLHEQSR